VGGTRIASPRKSYPSGLDVAETSACLKFLHARVIASRNRSLSRVACRSCAGSMINVSHPPVKCAGSSQPQTPPANRLRRRARVFGWEMNALDGPRRSSPRLRMFMGREKSKHPVDRLGLRPYLVGSWRARVTRPRSPRKRPACPTVLPRSRIPQPIKITVLGLAHPRPPLNERRLLNEAVWSMPTSRPGVDHRFVFWSEARTDRVLDRPRDVALLVL